MQFHSRRRTAAARRMAIIAVFVTGCGGASTDEMNDAFPADATCVCPNPPTLDTESVRQVPHLLMLDPGNDLGSGIYCDDGDIALGGSCSLGSISADMHMLYAGDIALPNFPHSWTCGWRNLSFEWQELRTAVICLHPNSNNSIGDECACPEYQPLAQRIDRVSRSAPYLSYSANELSVECSDGGTLLGGGCASPGTISLAHDATLSGSGFATEDATSWHCAWNAPGNVDGDYMLATAYCLQPPDYGPDPLADRIVHTSRTRTVPAFGYAGFTVSCEPGDFLLSGSCTLDAQSPNSHLAIMYHHGFDPDIPNAWQCAWSNPTEQSLSGTVTATCVKSPAE